MPGFFANTADFVRELLRRRCPRDIAEEGRSQEGPLIIAGHRGSPLFHPENTIPSFQRAIDDGANAIELDLCITRDGVIIAWHDWTPNGTVARIRWLEIEPQNNFRPWRPEDKYKAPVCHFDLDLFREKYGYVHKREIRCVDAEIPTLEQVLEWGVGEERLKTIFLDCKIPEGFSYLGEAFIGELDRIMAPHADRFELILEINGPGMLRHALCSTTVDRISWDHGVPSGVVFDITKYSSAIEAIRRNLGASLVLRPRMTTLAPWTTYRRIMKRELRLAAEAPAEGRPMVFAATINREDEFRCLRKMGVRAFQTDLPHVLSRIEPPAR